jgi:hypothetical protein
MTLQALPNTGPTAGLSTLPQFTVTLSANQLATFNPQDLFAACPWDVAPISLNLPSGAPVIWSAAAKNRIVLPAAGLWLVIASCYVRANANVAGNRGVRLAKNTVQLSETLLLMPACFDFVTQAQALVAANGTTDYIELYGLAGGTAWGFFASSLTSLQCVLLSA